MKHATKQRAPIFRLTLAILGLFASLAMLQPAEVQAAPTSGGATIFNEATVSYSTPTFPNQTAKGSTTVTVLTKAAAPFITVTPVAQSTGETTAITYVYNIINQSSGIADLAVNPTTPAITNTNIGAAGTNTLTVTAFPAMWGGIAIDIPANNEVKLPAGSLTGLAVNDTVAVKVGSVVYYYTVATVANGTPQSATNATETQATLTLTPLAHAGTAATALTATLVGGTAAGTIIGEYKSTTHNLTTGTVTTGVSGTHVTNITADATDTTTTVSYTTSAGAGNETTTTVYKTPVSVVKTANPTTAKPGETITYTIVVTNNTTEDTSGTTIADQLSTYVTYTPTTTTLNGNAVSDNGSAPVFPLSGAGISIDSAGTAGVIAAGATATIVYQVTVN